jgi:hypothetical protein
MMLNITVTGDRETIVKFDKVSAALHAQLLTVTKKYAVNLQQHVKGDKLSGQVLNRRSGALSSSIKLAVDDNGSSVYGRVFSSGDVKYAAFWEFGFQGTEQVSPHQRIVSHVFGRKVTPLAQRVKGHSRKVDQAPRSFMRSALADMAAEIKGAYVKAKDDAIAEAMGSKP